MLFRSNLLGALLVSPSRRSLRLAVRSYPCHLCSGHAIAFLKQLLHLVRGQIVLVWDNHKIHICPQTQEFIQKHRRLRVYCFPTCAPELNPVEYVWTQVSEHNASFAPHDMQELCSRTRSGISRTRSSHRRLMACLTSSGLSWK